MKASVLFDKSLLLLLKLFHVCPFFLVMLDFSFSFDWSNIVPHY